MCYSRQASALQKASIKPFYGVVLSQTRLRDIRKLLHPASTSSCDIVEEHLYKGSYSCSHYSHGYHLAGRVMLDLRAKELFLLEK